MLSTSRARADDCEPPAGFSPCIDSNALRLPPGRAHFFSIASPELTQPHSFEFGLGVSYFNRPVVLVVASPDPDGREVPVVKDVLDASFLWSYGALERLELTVAMPLTFYQRGSGIQALTSQSGDALSHATVRDPRVGVGVDFLPKPNPIYRAKARIELSLPTGDDQELAGERSFGLSPSIALEARAGRFYAGSEVGVRLRKQSVIAGARIGNQVLAAVGFGWIFVEPELLSVGAEAFILPTLASQDHVEPDGTRVEGGLLAPGEALLSLRSAPTPALSLELGGGIGLPLSSEERIEPDGSSDTEHFAGLTTPRFRLLLVARYTLDTLSSRKPIRRSQEAGR